VWNKPDEYQQTRTKDTEDGLERVVGLVEEQSNPEPKTPNPKP